MDIKNPKRALAVSLQSDKEHLSRIISGITGSEPIPAEGSLAGITHELRLETKYYTTTVPVWLDLIDSPSEWASSFLSDEAAEVLGVLGGLILIFAIPDSSGGSVASAPVAGGADDDDDNNPTRQLIRHVGTVVHQGLGGWAWDGVKLAVGVGGGGALDVDEWDELCAEAGLEFVQVGGDGDENKLQQFGEKSGIPRIKEALEANEWDLGSADELPSGEEEAAATAAAEGEEKKKKKNDEGDGKQRSSDDDKALLGPDDMDFGLDRAADLETLKKALFANSQEQQQQDYYNNGEEEEEQDIGDQDVAKVEAMMRKLQAAREAGETMGEAQRRKMAARAVEEVMRQL